MKFELVYILFSSCMDTRWDTRVVLPYNRVHTVCVRFPTLRKPGGKRSGCLAKINKFTFTIF